MYKIPINMSYNKSDFINALEIAVKKSKQAADNVEGGDPGTLVSAKVDGRCKNFIKTFKLHGNKQNGSYSFNGIPVTLSKDNGIHIDALKGTDYQLHSKKVALYETFGKCMKEQGYSCTVKVNTYSY